MVDHDKLRDPNAEYTMRDLSAETMDITNSRGGVRDAEITDVQTTMVDGNYPWILVRVYTDAGVVGTGESYWGGGDTAIIERMKPFIVGENPLDIDRLYEHLVQKMSGEGSISGRSSPPSPVSRSRSTTPPGSSSTCPPTSSSAGSTATRSGSTATSTPRTRPTRRRAPPRPSASSRTSATTPSSSTSMCRPATRKTAPTATSATPDRSQGRHRGGDHRGRRRQGRRGLRLPLVVHRRLREEALAEALEEYDVWWLEDPVPPENHDVQEEVTKSTTTPIAVGENVYRKHGQRTLLEPQAVDIVAPDLPRVGGMRETRKIADLADMYYIPVAMHNVSSPIGTMASAHVGAAIPNSLALEYHSYELGWWEDLVEEDNLIEEGRMEIPEEPGLGLTLNLDAVGEHMVEGETLFDEA